MKILIIEDEEAIRQTLQELLELNGHHVVAAADGPEGVRLAASAPDLILSDIGLPGLDGYAVIEAIQALPAGRDVPFIFLTARAGRSEQRRGMALGADDYITKPFTEREILDAIAARMKRQGTLRERVARLMEQRQRENAADWSHELLTPLNAVLGGLQLIEMEGEAIGPADLKTLLGFIREGAGRQQKVAHQLIRYFELERMKEQPRPADFRCDAGDALHTAAQRSATRHQRSADLRVEAESADVCLSLTLLVDALAELVDNALRFSRPGQPVIATGRRLNAAYVIEITDHGPGLTPDQCEAAGAFTQFDRTRREQQGLGLGIAIARLTAEAGQGRLRLRARAEGGGLVATVDLPLLNGQAAQPAPRGGPPGPG